MDFKSLLPNLDHYIWPVLMGLVVGLALLPLIKFIAWRLFRFDRNVQKILTQKKSSEVKLGKIAETLSPILEDFPVDVQKPGTSTVYVGQPLDFIHFDPEEGVTFIEVKSGDAKLNPNQKRLKNLIEEGRVYWAQLQVK